MDASVVENLAKHGDVAEKPRVVDHRAYFSATADRAGFAEAVRRKGFAVRREGEGGDGGRRLWVDFERTDPVVLDHIHEIAWELYQLAESFGGEYDGWGCVVTK